jgi:hypothetical protein
VESRDLLNGNKIHEISNFSYISKIFDILLAARKEARVRISLGNKRRKTIP